MDKKSGKGTRRIGLAAAAVYLVFLSAAAVAFLTIDDQDVLTMAMYLISSALMFVTLVFAVFVMRRSPSEAYREKYMDDEDGK